MEMKLIRRGTTGELHLNGFIDASNSVEVEEVFLDLTDRFDVLIMDMEKLEYVSSAGLRAFKRAYMAMRHKHGTLVAKNVSKAVMEVFEITGFTRLFKFI